MIEAYFDESGIHDGAAICVIAGYWGLASQWKWFNKKWRATLQDFNFPLEDFHATDLIRSRDHQPMLEKLAEVIASYHLYPVTVGIIVDDFNFFSLKQRKFMTGATLVGKTGKFSSSGNPDKPYFVPFGFCLRKITDYTKPGRQTNFFFGLDRPMAKYAKAMFKQLKAADDWPESGWKTKGRLGDPAFPLAKQTPQLQAADLLVLLSYQHMVERHTANNWRVPASGLLAKCLRNTKSKYDHVFMNKTTLQETLNGSHVEFGDWDEG
jgi:hypothetical protein